MLRCSGLEGKFQSYIVLVEASISQEASETSLVLFVDGACRIESFAFGLRSFQCKVLPNHLAFVVQSLKGSLESLCRVTFLSAVPRHVALWKVSKGLYDEAKASSISKTRLDWL